MRFTVTMKDPDARYEAVREAMKAERKKLAGTLLPSEINAVVELREEQATEFAGQFMQYGEYLSVEFDTEAGTATVLKRG